MLLEALIVTVCLRESYGCSESTSAYYKQSKQLQEITEAVERYGKKITHNNEWVVYVGTPLYAVVSRKPAKIHIYRGITFNVDLWNQAVALQWSY